MSIARAADTSETQVLKKFGTKEGLLDAIFEEDWAVLSSKFQAVELASPPLNRLKQFVRIVVDHVESDNDLKKLMAFEMGRVRRRPGPEVFVSNGYLESCLLVDDVLSEAARLGYLEDGLRPQALRSCLFGLMSQMWRDQLASPGSAEYSSAEILSMVERMLRCVETSRAHAASVS
jgi:AcrR family transcriptional regulator